MKLGILLAIAVLATPTLVQAERSVTAAPVPFEPTCAEQPGCLAVAYADLLASHDPELDVDELVVFDPGRLRIRAEARDRIREVARAWRESPGWGVITVEGYAFATDRVQAENLVLATRRADQVRRYLIRYGVAPEYVVAVSHVQDAAARRVGARVDLAIENCDPMLVACRARQRVSGAPPVTTAQR